MSKFGVVFLLMLAAAAFNAAVARDPTGKSRSARGRAQANERLTAVDGALLFVLLAGLGVTVLFIRPLLGVHYLLGFALIPPLGLKIYSTGYRFICYYRQDPDFMLAGPPPLLLRFGIAPVLIASTVAVMGSGLELWAFADRFGAWWVSAHTLSAVVFIVALFAHLLSHLRRSATALVDDFGSRPPEGAVTRRSVLLACTVLALVLAAASLSYASPFGSGSAGG